MNKVFSEDDIHIALVEDDILAEVVRGLYFHLVQYKGTVKDWYIDENDLDNTTLSFYVAAYVRRFIHKFEAK